MGFCALGKKIEVDSICFVHELVANGECVDRLSQLKGYVVDDGEETTHCTNI